MANIDQECYSVLRCGGASRLRACAEIGVSSGRSRRLEALFQAGHGCADARAQRPRFARHERHVDDVLAAGGYPALRR